MHIGQRRDPGSFVDIRQLLSICQGNPMGIILISRYPVEFILKPYMHVQDGVTLRLCGNLGCTLCMSVGHGANAASV